MGTSNVASDCPHRKQHPRITVARSAHRHRVWWAQCGRQCQAQAVFLVNFTKTKVQAHFLHVWKQEWLPISNEFHVRKDGSGARLQVARTTREMLLNLAKASERTPCRRYLSLKRGGRIVNEFRVERAVMHVECDPTHQICIRRVRYVRVHLEDIPEHTAHSRIPPPHTEMHTHTHTHTHTRARTHAHTPITTCTFSCFFQQACQEADASGRINYSFTESRTRVRMHRRGGMDMNQRRMHVYLGWRTHLLDTIDVVWP